MSETDPRVAFIHMVKEHLGYKPIVDVAKLIISDQFNDFWIAPFNEGDGRWNGDGGLAEATVLGYRSLRFLTTTAGELYTKANTDRMVGIYLSLMIARWADVRTLDKTFHQNQNDHANSTAIAVSNAISFGMDLTPSEVVAITRWYSSRVDLFKNYEKFSTEWWILSETMNWIFVANKI